MEQQIIRRGDGFDLGDSGNATNPGEGGESNSLTSLLQNPQNIRALSDRLHMSESQKKNLTSAAFGGNEALVHRLLGDMCSKMFGNVIGNAMAGAAGGALFGFLKDMLEGRR